MINVSTITQNNAPALGGYIHWSRSSNIGAILRSNRNQSQASFTPNKKDLKKALDLGKSSIFLTEEEKQQISDEKRSKWRAEWLNEYNNPLHRFDTAPNKLESYSLTDEERKWLVRSASQGLLHQATPDGSVILGREPRSIQDMTRLLKARLQELENNTEISDERRALEISILKEGFVEAVSGVYFHNRSRELSELYRTRTSQNRNFVSNFQTAKNFALNTMTIINNTTNNEVLRKLVAQAMHDTLTKAFSMSPIISISIADAGDKDTARTTWNNMMNQERNLRANGSLEKMLEDARNQLNSIIAR